MKKVHKVWAKIIRLYESVKMKKVNFNNWDMIIPEPEVFIDIGVGVPDSEAWKAKKTWPQIKIFGAEPCPERFNLCKNSFPGKLIECAVGIKDGLIEMQPIDGMVVNYPRKHQRKQKKINVQCRSLDSLDREFGPFNNVFLWADIEGAELDMLMGATNLLESGRVTCISLEIWSEYQTNGWCLKNAVVEYLAQFNYKPKYIWPGETQSILRDYLFLRNKN